MNRTRSIRFLPRLVILTARAATGPAVALLALGLCGAPLSAGTTPPRAFIRGDANTDGRLDLSDGVNTLGHLFLRGKASSCKDAADANDSGALDIADAIFTFSFLFLAGTPPPAPGLACGIDRTADSGAGELGCADYPPCGSIPGAAEPSARLQAGGMAEIEVSPVSEYVLTLEAGHRVQFEARNVQSDQVPILHLMAEGRSRIDACYCEVARADGGLTPRLTYSSFEGGRYRLIVRAAGNARGDSGSCDLYKDGAPWKLQAPFGGALVALDNLRQGEVLETVRLPNGAGPAHVLYGLGADGVSIRVRHAGGGLAGGVRCAPGTGSQRWVAAALSPAEGGLLRLVRNDVGLNHHDPDGDGLGTELEAAIGTCSALGGVATAAIPDWRFELLELRAMERCDRATATAVEYEECYQEILEFHDANRTRGFDCRQAADARDTDGDGISDGWELLGRGFPGNDQPLALWGADPRHKDLFVEVDFMRRQPAEGAVKMSAYIARDFARYYQDDVGTVSQARLGHGGASLVNPDGLPGVHVHLDTGLPPERPEDAPVYGDWGGYTAVPPVQGADGTWHGVKFWEAWREHLGPVRLGIFRYMLPYASGGGSVGINSFAISGGLNGDAYILTHESGHAMGLGHSGPDGAPSVNCKPNYPSIMNYAYGGLGFSDGLDVPALNNVAAREWQAVPPASSQYLDELEGRFRYTVDRLQGHVDWNRDGVFAYGRATVRAYANFMPGNSCEGTRANASLLPDAASIQTPAMARLGNRLYAFYSILGDLRYTYSTSAWDCPQPGSAPCGEWERWQAAYMNALGGVDVERIIVGKNLPRLLVVAIDYDGRLWEARLAVDGAGRESWTTPAPIPGSSAATGEPSLARLDAGLTLLVYKGVDGTMRHRKLMGAGWGAEQVSLTPAGQPVTIWEHAFPGIARAYLPWRPGTPGIYGAFAGPTGSLGIWHYDAGSDRWETTDVLESVPSHRVEGRPAMAWVPHQSGAEYPGRFYLAYVRRDPDESRGFRDKERFVVLLMSHTKVSGSQSTEVVGLTSYFDNVWFYAFGIDLLYEPGVDSNLRALSSVAIDKPEAWALIEFRPKADGINNLTYVNYNDWETIRLGLCRNVVNPDGSIANPIRCP